MPSSSEQQDAIGRLRVKRVINRKLQEMGIGTIPADRGTYLVPYETMAKLVGVSVDPMPIQDRYEVELEREKPPHTRKYRVTFPPKGSTINTAMCHFEFYDEQLGEWSALVNLSRQQLVLTTVVEKFGLHELMG